LSGGASLAAVAARLCLAPPAAPSSQPAATGTPTSTVTTPAHQAVSTRVAEDGTVLLNNQGQVLPLTARHGGTIAVSGPSASASPTDGGGGRARVTGPV